MSGSSLMLRLCRWIAPRFPLRVIYIDGEPYLRRFYVAGPAPLSYWPSGTRVFLERLPFVVYLHEFLQPDRDRELHNHPWTWAFSVILSGGYDEERRVGSDVMARVVRPGRVNVIRGSDFHRVTHLRDETVWTLFVTSRKATSWGFWDREKNVVIPWRRHVFRPRVVGSASR